MADPVQQMIRFRQVIENLTEHLDRVEAKVDILLERSAVEFDTDTLGELIEIAGEPTQQMPRRGRPKKEG